MISVIRRAIVDDRHKLIYVEIGKSACSSIKFAIGESLAMPESAIDEWLWGAVPDVDIADERYQDYFKFTFVRNPWDRAVSCYLDKFSDPESGSPASERYAKPLARALGKERASFEDYLVHISGQPDDKADMHWKSQHATVFTADGTNVCQFVGRFEQLTRDFEEVSRTVGLNVALRHKNRGRDRKPYPEYFDATTRELLARRYADDIRAFSYSF